MIYQNLHSFPVKDADGKLQFVATIFETTRIYQGKAEIIKAKEYIQTHWKEKFSLEQAASASSLSRSHFARLFKLHIGMTPHQYYQRIRINQVQKHLLNDNLSAAQAFAECGMEYNSHYLKIFRNQTSMAPAAYTQSHLKTFQINTD